MTGNNIPSQAGGSEVSPRTPRVHRRSMIWGFLAFMAIAAIAIPVVGFVMYRSTVDATAYVRAADVTADEFVSSLRSGDISRAYSLTSTGWRKLASQSQFERIVETWSGQVGKVQNIKPNGWRLVSTTSGTTYMRSYSVQGDLSKSIVTVTVASEGGHCAIQACNFALNGSTP